MAQRSCKEQRRILDEATRMRRARKALESLESDNFHDDPHADLVRHHSFIVCFLTVSVKSTLSYSQIKRLKLN